MVRAQVRLAACAEVVADTGFAENAIRPNVKVTVLARALVATNRDILMCRP
jgi:hypothetical protein